MDNVKTQPWVTLVKISYFNAHTTERTFKQLPQRTKTLWPRRHTHTKELLNWITSLTDVLVKQHKVPASPLSSESLYSYTTQFAAQLHLHLHVSTLTQLCLWVDSWDSNRHRGWIQFHFSNRLYRLLEPERVLVVSQL